MGTFPVSVAVHGDLVYVLNAENGGSVQGFYAGLGRLFPHPRVDPAAGPGTRRPRRSSPTPPVRWPSRPTGPS